MRGEQPKLRYVFDVADTGERKNSRPVQLWKMNAEHEQPIIRALDAAFDVPAGAGSLENHIMESGRTPCKGLLGKLRPPSPIAMVPSAP